MSATPSRRFDAPHRFLYETMIASHAPTPTQERELTLSFFLNLRAKLVELRDDLRPRSTRWARCSRSTTAWGY